MSVTMIINNQDISNFNARLLSYSVGSPEITNSHFLGFDSAFPRLLHTKVRTRPLQFTLEFSGSNRVQVAQTISKLGALLYRDGVLSLPDGYQYRYIFQSDGAAEEICSTTFTVTYACIAVRFGALITVPISIGSMVNCLSNLPKTDCIIEVTPPSGTTEITAAGITVNNLTPGEKLIIDGIACTIMQGSVNKFADSNIIEWPKLEPGENQISSSSPGILKYYPIYM